MGCGAGTPCCVACRSALRALLLLLLPPVSYRTRSPSIYQYVCRRSKFAPSLRSCPRARPHLQQLQLVQAPLACCHVSLGGGLVAAQEGAAGVQAAACEACGATRGDEAPVMRWCVAVV